MQGRKTKSSNPASAPHVRRGGFVLISSAALLIGLTAFLGLAFDIGDLEWTRRRLQIAADTAANARTREILPGSSSSMIVSAAKADAALNGFTDGSNGRR